MPLDSPATPHSGTGPGELEVPVDGVLVGMEVVEELEDLDRDLDHLRLRHSVPPRAPAPPPPLRVGGGGEGVTRRVYVCVCVCARVCACACMSEWRFG